MLVLVILLGDMKPYASRLGFGLAFCAIGDVCLELDAGGWKPAPFFLIGLASFLIGHCCYAVAFLCNRIELTLLKTAPVLVYVVSIFLVLRPSLPPNMFMPVLAYTAIIGIMCVLALCRRPSGSHATQWSSRCSALGAIVFCGSDTILSYNRFVVPVPHAKYWIMLTYYAAQYILVMSARGAMARPLTKALGSVENFSSMKNS